MKKTITKIIMLALIGLNTVTNGQTPDWIWAKSAGGTGSENSNSSATDASGYVYVTGSYSSPTLSFGATTLTNAGGTDMFLVKYDASGNVIWAKGAGRSGNDYGQSVATDAFGNVYVTGGFSSGLIIFGTDTLTNAGGTDIMVVKYNASGNVIWAKGEGSTGTEFGQSIATDASGNVCITGNFDSPSITLGATTLTYTGHPTIFIAKFDSSGNALWANRPVGGVIDNRGLGITTDAFGNVFVTGYFDHGGITFGTITVYDHGGLGVIFDMFVVKYNASGNAVWAKGAGSGGDDRGYSITTDPFGNVYVTGGTNYPYINFDAYRLTINAGGIDMFIAKYDTSGNLLWAKGAGGSVDDYIHSSTTDASGNLYVTGYYNSPSISFGASQLLVNTDGWGVTYDMFLAKYDTSGNLLWAMSEGGGYGDDKGYSITTDSSGNVYVTGNYSSPTITFGATTLSNAGGSDMFIAKLDTMTIMTGTHDASASLNMTSIFPNPAITHLTIALPGYTEKVEVTITDIAGKIIYTTTTDETNKIEVNTSEFAEGIYIVQIQAADFIEAKKLVVEK